MGRDESQAERKVFGLENAVQEQQLPKCLVPKDLRGVSVRFGIHHQTDARDHPLVLAIKGQPTGLSGNRGTAGGSSTMGRPMAARLQLIWTKSG